MSARADELRAQIASARSELNEIENSERQLANESLMGRYFKFRNSYSLPKTEADYWWLYAYIETVDDGVAQAIMFQTDRDGKIEIESRSFYGLNGYVEIEADEYIAARSAMLRRATENTNPIQST